MRSSPRNETALDCNYISCTRKLHHLLRSEVSCNLGAERRLCAIVVRDNGEPFLARAVEPSEYPVVRVVSAAIVFGFFFQ